MYPSFVAKLKAKDNVQKGWRTHEQKEELILQWQQNKKSRKEFCLEQGICYNSLVSWCKEMRDKKIVKWIYRGKIKSYAACGGLASPTASTDIRPLH